MDNFPDLSGLTPQSVQLHQGATAEVECSTDATMDDGSGNQVPVTLSGFRGQVHDGAAVSILLDEDPTDDKDEVTAAGDASVGDTSTIWYVADGSDGKTYGAVLAVGIVEKTVAVVGMNIKFTELAAA